MSRRAPEITRTAPPVRIIRSSPSVAERELSPEAPVKCPWRVDATGEFPADAFRHSAETAYDMATET